MAWFVGRTLVSPVAQFIASRLTNVRARVRSSDKLSAGEGLSMVPDRPFAYLCAPSLR